MSKAVTNQNLKLLQAIQSEICFLNLFNNEQLSELSTRASFIVFSQKTVLAQEKEEIDFIGIILQGKVKISGENQNKSSGYMIGELGYFGILDKHAFSVVGDSDGIIMAIRFDDFQKLDKAIRSIVHLFLIEKSIEILKNQEKQWVQTQQVQQKKLAHLLSLNLKTLLNEVLDQKQKQLLLKYFPFCRYRSKSKIVSKTDEPYFLAIAKGELVVRHEDENGSLNTVKIGAGQMFNCEGFLLNYTTHSNIYCFSDEAIVLKVNRRAASNLLQLGLMLKIDNFLLRKQIKQRNYEVVTSQIRKEKQRLKDNQNNKWSIFTKPTYEIIPLVLPKKNEKEKAKQIDKGDNTQKLSILFRQYQQQSKNMKTNSSMNSKMNKIITMKTEKVELRQTSIEDKAKNLQKELQQISSKVRFYQQNFNNCKLEMIEYRSRFRMNAVLKQIVQYGQKKYRAKTDQASNYSSLKQAFEQHMKQNRIMEVVARCAYKWLWAVRRKKKFSGFRITK